MKMRRGLIDLGNVFICKHYLTESIWNRFLQTYPCGKIEDIWRATFLMCDLFDEVAKEVAIAMGYNYKEEEAKASRGHLEHVRQLPKDAKHYD